MIKVNKNLFIVCFCCICCCFSAFLCNFSPLSAYEDVTQSTVTILGEAKQKVDPDCASVFMSIENVDMNAEISKDLTLTMYQKVLEKLEEMGVNKTDIKMSYFRTYPSFDYTNGKTLKGNFAVLDFNYKLKDLSKVNETIDALYDLGITNINHINYEVTKTQDVYNDLLIKALENAESKAKLILGKDDLTLIKMCEENTYFCTTVYRNYADKSLNDSASNQVEISARVNATFK